MSKKNTVSNVLAEFYNTNLSSQSAREWLAEQIVNKLEDDSYQVVQPTVDRKPGAFEEYMSKIDSKNEKINKEIERQIEKGPEKIEVNKPIAKKAKATIIIKYTSILSAKFVSILLLKSN